MAVGKLGAFEVSSGNWSMYTERLEMYFKANDIKPEVQLPTLIAVMGEEAYELLSNLTSPRKPGELTYAEVIKMMRDHVEPKPSFMAERYRFRLRRQGAEETVAQYLADLKKLSKHCEFGPSLQENLRDQFTCGLKNDTIKQRLFAEKILTYTMAVSLALSLEAAERDAAMVERPSASESRGNVTGFDMAPVNSLSSRPRGGNISYNPNNRQNNSSNSTNMQGDATMCAVCGRQGHRESGCRYKKFTCRRCGAVGHLKRVCPAWEPAGNHDTAKGRSAGAGGRRAGAGGRGPRRALHHVQAAGQETPGPDEEISSASDIEEDMYHLCLNGYRPVSMSLCVDNKVISMEVDTGSAVSCISKDTYLKYFGHRPIEPFDLTLKFYDGSKVKPLGVIRPDVLYEGKQKTLELFVIEGGTTSLLGRQWLTELGIQIPVFSCQSVSNDELCKLLDRYKELFSGGLGRFTGGKATLRVREDATPVYCRARPLPYALRDRVDQELDEMSRNGVIEPVDTSEWATPLVPDIPSEHQNPTAEAAPTPATPGCSRPLARSSRPPHTPTREVIQPGSARHGTPPSPPSGSSETPQPSPLPPPEPPQPRHIRECRVIHPPQYKF